jgi:hypothetical protein
MESSAISRLVGVSEKGVKYIAQPNSVTPEELQVKLKMLMIKKNRQDK